jgi:glycosyltransferase involved in cell wall biosynthesis
VASIIIPAHFEGESIKKGLMALLDSVRTPSEILVVVDSNNDSTIDPVRQLGLENRTVKLLVNNYGPGPANAIRWGIDHSKGRIVVVTMGDGCDDPRQVDELANLVLRGVVIASASRYMPGGQQVGGPRFKRLLSKLAGRSFAAFTGVGTRDATNSFKAYDKNFLMSVGVDSRDGFEIGLELTAKARRGNLSVAEIPTTWIDRSHGESKFKLARWLPKYFSWYLYGLGFPHPNASVRAQMKQKEKK